MAEENRFEHIANRLRRGILRGDLAPGSPIKERDNAAEMGVSRTPMREAIRQLANEGLVVLRPSRSPIVADPSWKEISDCMDLVRALELLSGELACAKATDEEIDQIAAIQARMEAESNSIDEIDLFEIDMEFHVAIVRASHNIPLAETHRSLLSRLWRARFLGSRAGRNQDRVFAQHQAILAALRARNAAAFQAELRNHLSILKQQIRQFYQEVEEETA